MRKVYLEFAKHYFDEDIAKLDRNHTHEYAVQNSRPFYNQLYDIINSEIDKYTPHNRAMVSRLDGRVEWMALQMMQRRALPDISSIKVPFTVNERQYPNVNYGYFTR